MSTQRLRIGTLARRVGVGIDTVRYYEKRGLLRPTGRSASSYRLYDEGSVVRLRFIRRARELGFSLDRIGELLELWSRRGVACDEARHEAELHLSEVERRISSLERVRDSLQELVAACTSHREDDGCPLLAALACEEHDGASSAAIAGTDSTRIRIRKPTRERPRRRGGAG